MLMIYCEGVQKCKVSKNLSGTLHLPSSTEIAATKPTIDLEAFFPTYVIKIFKLKLFWHVKH